jgi:hypothetical protein
MKKVVKPKVKKGKTRFDFVTDMYIKNPKVKDDVVLKAIKKKYPKSKVSEKLLTSVKNILRNNGIEVKQVDI